LNLVSIDPGLRHCGVAFFDEGVLVKAFLVKNEEVVRAVVESYFRANFAVRHRMVELVQDDSQITGEKFKADQAKNQQR
jgi:hypothetical protein